MRALAPLLLVLASIISYFVLSAGFGVFQCVPWPHLLIAGLACVWALRQVLQLKDATLLRRGLGFVSVALCVLLTGLYGWYTLSYSNYPPGQGVAAGERIAQLPGMQLTSHDGSPAAVLAERATLLVFYRGFW